MRSSQRSNEIKRNKLSLIIKVVICVFIYASFWTLTASPSSMLHHDHNNYATELLQHLKQQFSQTSIEHPKKISLGEGVAESDIDPEMKFDADREMVDSNPSKDRPFKKYDGVVFVTKLLRDGQQDLKDVMTMLCYLQHAYNDKMNYDIIIFTTIPWKEENIKRVQDIVGPETKLTVAVEGPPLEEQLAAMTKEELDFLYDRCRFKNETHPEPLTWDHYCEEKREGGSVNSLGYGWQAEFRAYHIWNHLALKPYKYMFWIDTDSRLAMTWDKDPFEMMIENDLITLFAGYPCGKIETQAVRRKISGAYGKDLCYTKKNEFGELYGGLCKPGDKNSFFRIRQVMGNHHITNLDVFRKPIHQTFLKNFTGDYRFSRMHDDQAAVTIVSIMEQILTDPTAKHTRIWHERSKNMTMKIHHHGIFDEIYTERGPREMGAYWKKYSQTWEGMKDRCPHPKDILDFKKPRV